VDCQKWHGRNAGRKDTLGLPCPRPGEDQARGSRGAFLEGRFGRGQGPAVTAEPEDGAGNRKLDEERLPLVAKGAVPARALMYCSSPIFRSSTFGPDG
jgi:hypothetical protein